MARHGRKKSENKVIEGSGTKYVNPFREPGEDVYFNLHRIMEPYEISEKTLQEAKKLISSKEITLEEVTLTHTIDAGEGQCLQAEGVVEQRYRMFYVRATISATALLTIRCQNYDCYTAISDYYLQDMGFYRSQEMCEHQVALFLLLEEYILANNPGDATNQYADQLLARVRMQYGRRLPAEEGKAGDGHSRVKNVQLKPRLLQDGDDWELGFHIGKEKLYILKNMQELFQTCRVRGVLELGKNNAVDFAGEYFDEASKPWFELIRRAITEAAHLEQIHIDRNGGRYYHTQDLNLIPVKTIPLYGSMMDAFFRLAMEQGRGVEHEQTVMERDWNDRRKRTRRKQTLTMEERTIRPSLRGEGRFSPEGRFEGVSITGQMPAVIFGADYGYFLDGTALCRTSSAELDPIRGLLGSRDDEGNVSLMFGRRSMAQLFHQVLPTLEPYVDLQLQDEETLQDYIPPTPDFSFWLDADGVMVSCRIEAVYGEKRYNVVGCLDESRPLDPERDSDMEEMVLERLVEYFTSYDPMPEQPTLASLLMDQEEERVFRLLDSGLHVMMQMGEVHTTGRFDRLKLRRRPQFTIGVSMQTGLMNLSVISDDLDLQELQDILESYRQKRPYHRLKNGDFLKLDDPTLGELSDMLDAMHIPLKEFVKGKMHLPTYRALYLERMLEESEGLYADRDRRFRQLVKEFKTVGDSDFDLPDSLQHVLREYQRVGYEWLRTIEMYGFGGVLADEMGLGKTVQMIAVLLAAKEDGRLQGVGAACPQEEVEADPIRRAGALIVTPASLVYNWAEECARFAPSLKVCVVAGSQKTRQMLIEEARGAVLEHDAATVQAPAGALETMQSGAGTYVTEGSGNSSFDAEVSVNGAPDVLITSYDLLKRDIDCYEGMQFAYEVIDEAQFIKNHSTAAAKAVKVIEAEHRFALTGTPIENRLSELWSIFDFLMPGFLYGYEVFRREFETPIVKRDDEGARRQLKRMVAPFILRRCKAEVLTDLPDKLEEVRYVNFETKQRRIYDGQVVKMKQMMAAQSPEEFQKNKIQVLAELTRIRQICCDPTLLFEDYHGGSAKREAAAELITSAAEAGHKMLVFSQFTSMLALLEEDLTKAGLSCYKIIGETPKRKRAELVRAFNQDDTPVFLISLKAGGTGLNLTGADIVIHYDPWWNLAVQNQATDRAHRIGQEKNVTVYRMIARGTIEERILQMQDAKRQLAEEILSGETGSITRMSQEELLELL